MSEKVNTKEEKYTLNLTEWEIDIISQAIQLANYPGNVTELAVNLIKKVEGVKNGDNNNNDV